MAKKKTSSGTTAETPKSASKKAKRAPLSNSAIRFVGFLVAFIGIMLILSKATIIDIILEVVSVFLILWGLFLVSGSAKKINSASDKNKVYLNLLLGLVMIVCGILLIVFRGQIQNYFIIIAGCAIGVYGLLMLIKFLCSPRTRKSVFNVVMSVLTIVTGILICLLFVPQISSAANGVCYIIFGAFATAVGCLEIICY